MLGHNDSQIWLRENDARNAARGWALRAGRPKFLRDFYRWPVQMQVTATTVPAVIRESRLREFSSTSQGTAPAAETDSGAHFVFPTSTKRIHL
jgi:hypothetical protein